MQSKDVRILLVDDFEMMRVMLKRHLNELGFTNTVEAEDGKQALAAVRENHQAGTPVQIVFCDWNMPEMTGLEVLQACRASALFKDLPFVMVTAEAEASSLRAATEAGVTEYLIKPLNFEQVKSKLLTVLTNAGLSAA